MTALQSYIQANYDVPASTIIIVNPTNTDTLEFNGQTISAPSYGVVGVDNRFTASSGSATSETSVFGKISAARDPQTGAPALVNFQGVKSGQVDTQWHDVTEAEQTFGWTSDGMNLQTYTNFYTSGLPLESLSIGETDGNVTTTTTSIDPTTLQQTYTTSQGSGFDTQIDVAPSSHTGDLFSATPVSITHNGFLEIQGGEVTGHNSVSEVQQQPNYSALLNLSGFENQDFGLDLDESGKNYGTSTTTTTQYTINQWNQWDYNTYSSGDRVYGEEPDFTTAQVVNQTTSTYNSTAQTFTSANNRPALNIKDYQLAAGAGANGGAGGGGGGGGSGGAGGGSGGSGSGGGSSGSGGSGGNAATAGVSVATFEANETQLDAAAGGFSVVDTAANIALGLNALNADGSITTITVGDAATTPLTLTVAEALVDQVAIGKLAPANVAIDLSDSAAAIENLTPQQITRLTTSHVALLRADDAGISFDAAQVLALLATSIDVAAPAGAAVTLTDTAAGLKALTATQIAALPGLGVNALSVSGGNLALDVAQIAAFETAAEPIATTGGATVALADSSGDLGGLTPGQIAGLSALHVSSIEVEAGNVQVTVAQAIAYEAAGIPITAASGSTVTLADTAANIATLTAGQLADLASVGIGYSAPIVVGAGSTTTISSPNTSVEATGPGATVDVADIGETISIASGTVNVWDNGAATVNGNGNTVTFYADGSGSVDGTGNTIDFAAAGSDIAASNATLNLWDGSTATVTGDADVATLYDNASLSTSGFYEVVDVAGSGDTVSVGNSAINLWNGAGATVEGNGNTITLYNQTALTASGTETSIVVDGNSATVVATSATVAFDDGDSGTVSGSGNALVLNTNDTVTSTGTNQRATIQGTGDSLTIQSAQVGLSDQSGAAVAGNGNSFTVYGRSTLAVSGSSENFTFTANPGTSHISGYDSSDTVQFSQSTFANWQSLLGHMTQSGTDTVIHVGPSDTVTLKNVALSSLDQNHFHFV